MFQELKDIRFHKQRLVRECELQRNTVQVEVEHLEKQLAWVVTVRNLISKSGPFLVFLAPLAGFALSKGLGGRLAAGGLGERALGLWNMVNKVRSYYNGFLTAREMLQSKLSELRASRTV